MAFDIVLETLDDLGTIVLEQHDGTSCYAETEFELFRELFDELQHHLVGWKITAFGKTTR